MDWNSYSGYNSPIHALEFYVACDIPDITVYRLHYGPFGPDDPFGPDEPDGPDEPGVYWNFEPNSNNSVNYSKGSFIWFTNTNNEVFNSYFGFNAQFMFMRSFDPMRDHIYILRLFKNEVLVDTFGESNTAYSNSYATRNIGRFPSSTYNANHWTIPRNALLGQTTGTNVPVKSYYCVSLHYLCVSQICCPD
eukprot:GHVR01110619.1.p1 GENE.GHVR01110619.1~~GHVR01110619.1.p1  ORF type:complete len:192 (-),score=12.76 GHVR01110619.1:122-697(-)